MEQKQVGCLYLCATPIGNLEDITLRVLRILKEVDLIAAEDTRNSVHLLQHFDIHTPMTSYHEFNKIEKAYQLIEKMKKGTRVALITDAGTPGISDPGEELVRLCREQGIPVTSLPGAAACITALSMSGLSSRRFTFEAFLPREKKARLTVLKELEHDTRTIILYEAPHHLKKTLKELYQVLGNRRISVCRELTKKFETVFLTTLEHALDFYNKEEPRGEFVLILEGCSREKLVEEERDRWKQLSVSEHMEYYLNQGLDQKTAMKQVAKDRGVGKREIYQMILEEKHV